MKHNKKRKQTSVAKRVYPKAAMDYVNDPYFVKKREIASELLKKAGLPESFKNIEN